MRSRPKLHGRPGGMGRATSPGVLRVVLDAYQLRSGAVTIRSAGWSVNSV